jgi:hypothetical protein
MNIGTPIPPGREMVVEKLSNDLNRFKDYKIVYDQLITSSIMKSGTTRAFINLYDDDYKLANQFIIKEQDYSQLTSNEIISQSQAIKIDNDIIIYFYQFFIDETYRHVLLNIDITEVDNPSVRFIELADSPNIVNQDLNSKVKLEYINNRLYLNIFNSISSFSVTKISYDLDNNPVNDFYQGTMTDYLNSSITSVSSNRLTDYSNVSIEYCNRIGNVVFCTQTGVANKFYRLDLPSLNIIEELVSFNNVLIIRNTLLDSGNTLDVVRLYLYQVNETSDALEAKLISYQNLNQINNNETNTEVIFPHITIEQGELTSFKFLSAANIFNYNFNLNVFDQPSPKGTSSYVEIFYNQNGQRIEVEKVGDLIYASSDFYQLTFVIYLANRKVLAYNYYQDKLLIFAKHSTLNTYYYYTYPILPSANQSGLVSLFEVTQQEMQTGISNQISDPAAPYNVPIKIHSAFFYKDQIYLLDSNVLDFSQEITTQKLYIIHLTPAKIMTILPYNFTAEPGITGYTINDLEENTFYMNFRSTTDGHYAAVRAYIDGFETVDLYLYINNTDIVETVGVGPGWFKRIYYSLFPNASNADGEFNNNGREKIYHRFDGVTRRITYIESGTYEIFDIVNDATTVIAMPKELLESYVGGKFDQIYTDFDSFFPLDMIFFRVDEHENMIIKDVYNNIFTLYSLEFLKLNNPGLISINNEFLDINANSFDLAVSANINSIIINIKSFFNRVLVTNPTPFSLNDGQNAINITLKALDNTIKTITFNILKAPAIASNQPIPPFVLPGIDRNYSSSSSSSVVSSSSSSSVISSVSSINTPSNSAISSPNSSNSSTSSTNSSITSASSANNNAEYLNLFGFENPFILMFLLLFPLVVLAGIILLSKGNKRKIKKKKNLNK